jgi:hypothetical protein
MPVPGTPGLDGKMTNDHGDGVYTRPAVPCRASIGRFIEKSRDFWPLRVGKLAPLNATE